MAISVKLAHVITFTILLHYFITVQLTQSLDSNSDRIDDLLTLQSRSKSGGLIHLNDNSLRRFLSSADVPRPYSLLIFFDAAKLHQNPDLHLGELRAEFGLLASSFISNHKGKPSQAKLFFCDLEFSESRSAFELFDVNSLPDIRLVSNYVQDMKDSDQMDHTEISKFAESVAEYIEAKIGLKVGDIHRPPMFSNKQLGLLILVLAISAPFGIKHLMNGHTIFHETKFWVSGALFIYFFSVSGTMHNIIRNMPMFMDDQNDDSKLIFFYQGSEMQLGAESFAVGFLYMIVGLLLALVTHGLVLVNNVTAQRLIMIFALLVSVWAVSKVVSLANWKTGYGIHGYWPSSWN